MVHAEIFKDFEVLNRLDRNFQTLGQILGIDLKAKGSLVEMIPRLGNLKCDPSPIQADLRVGQDWFDFEKLAPKSLIDLQEGLADALVDNFKQNGEWKDDLQQNLSGYDLRWYLLKSDFGSVVTLVVSNASNWGVGEERGFRSWFLPFYFNLKFRFNKSDRGLREEVKNGGSKVRTEVKKFLFPAKEFVMDKYCLPRDLVDRLAGRESIKTLKKDFSTVEKATMESAREELRESKKRRLDGENENQFEWRTKRVSHARESELETRHSHDAEVNESVFTTIQQHSQAKFLVQKQHEQEQRIRADSDKLAQFADSIRERISLHWLFRLKFQINLDSPCFAKNIGVPFHELEEVHNEHKMRDSRQELLNQIAENNQADEKTVKSTYEAIFASYSKDKTALRNALRQFLKNDEKLNIVQLKQQLSAEFKNYFEIGE